MFNKDLMYSQLVLGTVTNYKLISNHCKACLLCNRGLCSMPCRSPYHKHKNLLDIYLEEKGE